MRLRSCPINPHDFVLTLEIDCRILHLHGPLMEWIAVQVLAVAPALAGPQLVGQVEDPVPG